MYLHNSHAAVNEVFIVWIYRVTYQSFGGKAAVLLYFKPGRHAVNMFLCIHDEQENEAV